MGARGVGTQNGVGAHDRRQGGLDGSGGRDGGKTVMWLPRDPLDTAVSTATCSVEIPVLPAGEPRLWDSRGMPFFNSLFDMRKNASSAWATPGNSPG